MRRAIKFQVLGLEKAEIGGITISFYTDAPTEDNDSTMYVTASYFGADEGLGSVDDEAMQTSGNGTTDTYTVWIPPGIFYGVDVDGVCDYTSKAYFKLYVDVKDPDNSSMEYVTALRAYPNNPEQRYVMTAQTR